MRILKQYDNSQPGNDCYIYEEWVKVSICDKIVILRAQRVSGWCEQGLEVTQFTDPESFGVPEEIKSWFKQEVKMKYDPYIEWNLSQPKGVATIQFHGDQTVNMFNSTYVKVEGKVVMNLVKCNYFVYLKLREDNMKWVITTYDERGDLGEHNPFVIEHMDNFRLFGDSVPEYIKETISRRKRLIADCLSYELNSAKDIDTLRAKAEENFWNYAVQMHAERIEEINHKYKERLRWASEDLEHCQKQLRKLSL